MGTGTTRSSPRAPQPRHARARKRKCCGAPNSDSSPATGQGSSAATRPFTTATCPPPIWASRLAATAISASSTPTTPTLCASCARVEASAPRRSPKPDTNPMPMRPVPRCRSITATLAKSRSGSAVAYPFDLPGSATRARVVRFPGSRPMTRTGPSAVTRKSAAASAGIRTLSRIHAGACAFGIGTACPCCATSRPRFQTLLGRKWPRSGTATISAR